MSFDLDEVAFENSALGRLYARNKPGCLIVLILALAALAFIIRRQISG